MRTLSRREFLKRISLGAAGAYAAPNSPRTHAPAVAGKGGEGRGAPDTQQGAPFKDPVEMRNASIIPGIVEVNVEARPALVSVNGTMANLLTYNGAFPAPTIRVKRGDVLKVHFKSSLPEMGTTILGYDREITNLRTHGLHVSPGWNSDNSMLVFSSGNSFDYEFDLGKQRPGTLHLYHPFSLGTAAEQFWGGMAGALVVEDEIPLLAGFETHLMVLKDISLSGGAPEPYTSRQEYLNGKEGDTVMVNGQVNPVLSIRPEQVQRWRVVNASNARFYNLSLENHSLHIIGTDGGPLDKPYPVSSLVLAPGERLDILIKANRKTKDYRLVALPYDRGVGGIGRQAALLTLSCGGARSNDALPAILNPSVRRIAANPEKNEQLVVRVDGGDASINGISYSDSEAYTIESESGKYESWEIVNESSMDIPFHPQVNPFQVVSLTGGDAAYAAFYTKTPAWKDTVIVPGQGKARIVIPVMDFTGMPLIHSRILEQADIGMIGIWEIVEAVETKRAETDPP